MAQAIIDTALLTGIADAIRDKTGDASPIKLGEMADKIESISGGGEWPVTATFSPADAMIPCDITIDDFTGFNNISYAFQYNSNVRKIITNNFPGGNMATGMFSYSGLEEAEITSDVTKLTGTFSTAKKLQKIKFPTTPLATASNPFNGCTAVQEIIVPSMDWWANSYTGTGASTYPNYNSLTNNVTLKDYDGNELTNAIIKDNDTGHYARLTISSISHGGIQSSMDNYMFNYSRFIADVSIPSTIKTIGTYAFAYANFQGHTLTIPDTVTSLGGYCFQSAGNLDRLDLPSSLTSLPGSCFANTKIKHVYVPDSVTSIGTSCWNGAGSNEDRVAVHFTRTTPPTLTSASNMFSTYTDVYVPAELVNTYKTATNWSTHASKIKAEP